MKKNKPGQLAIALLLLTVSPFVISWGTFGHEHINHAAVLSLPAPLQTFFYNHIDFVTQESTVPDLRKYTLNDKTENPRHFVDLENFGLLDSLPKTEEALKSKYDEKFLNQNGILPWYLEKMMEKLTKAFKEKRKTEILFLAADIGHYVGDAHMPLHTSANYDGQLTDQKGIHALWETRLPELFGNAFNFKSSEAIYFADVKKEIWAIVFDSHTLVAPLLLADKKAKENVPKEEILVTDKDGNPIKNRFNQTIFSEKYANAFHQQLNGMVEMQMRKAIQATANFWYTAWVNAGKPDLTDLDTKEITVRNMEPLKQELKLFKDGKLFGLESEKEF